MARRFRKTFEKFDGLQMDAAERIGTRRRKSENGLPEDHHAYQFLDFDGSYAMSYSSFLYIGIAAL